MVDIIHIHEDDWGMRNLYPFAALSDAEKDIAEAAAAAERNRNPSGFGYTDMYIASPPSDRQLLWHFAGKLLFIQVMNQQQLMKGRRCRLNDRNVVESGRATFLDKTKRADIREVILVPLG